MVPALRMKDTVRDQMTIMIVFSIGAMVDGQLHDKRRVLFPKSLVDKNSDDTKHHNVQSHNAPRYISGIFPEYGGRNKCQYGEPRGAGNKRN